MDLAGLSEPNCVDLSEGTDSWLECMGLNCSEGMQRWSDLAESFQKVLHRVVLE